MGAGKCWGRQWEWWWPAVQRGQKVATLVSPKTMSFSNARRDGGGSECVSQGVEGEGGVLEGWLPGSKAKGWGGVCK